MNARGYREQRAYTDDEFGDIERNPLRERDGDPERVDERDQQ
jgi:hypothetical protein